MSIEKAVRNGWAREIRSDLLDALRERAKQYTNIINEGWLSAGGTDFSYYVGVNDDDDLWVDVYEKEDDFENERPALAEFRIQLRVKPVTTSMDASTEGTT